MATNGTMQGNSVNIGGNGGNYFYIDWQLASQSIANNTSTINWQAKFHFNSADSQLDNGTANLSGVRWSVPGRVKNFEFNNTTRNITLYSGSFTVEHDYYGQHSLQVSGGVDVYNIGRSAGSQSFSLPTIPQPPTTTLDSPANNTTLTTTTPTLAFTATDPQGENVQYQVQVSTSSSFNTLHTDHVTATYPSGVQQSYTLTTPLTIGSIDYYWRVRAKDPDGSDSWGEWSEVRKMTTQKTAPVVNFTASPLTGKRPVEVTFTDQSNQQPISWLWDFGDGTTSTSQNPIKTYQSAGNYTVSLTATNSVGSNTETKVNYITIQPEMFNRSTSGTLKFAGQATPRLTAYREAVGTLLFGGTTRAVLLRDAEALQDKIYLYKVYNPDGTYVETWKDVISELNFAHEINTIGSTTTVELARNSDTLGVTTAPLQTEDGQNILTEDDQTILVATESRNQIGSGSSVDYNNRVDITAYYGSVEPLYTESMEEILTEDGEPILAELGAPNGRRVFTGFISEINSRYGSTESTIVQLTSYGYDLDQYPVTTAYNNNTTTVPFNSYDPSNIVSTAVDRFMQTANQEQVSYTMRTPTSIQLSGSVVSYTFRNNTYKEVLDKTIELLPSNWYYRIGLGDNTVYVRERSATPQHLFYLGKHIKALDLKGTILDVVNHTLFTGGGDPALYIERKEAPAPRTRRGLEIMSDSRVTLEESAGIISEGTIEQKNKLQYRTTVEILSKQYDIESIQVGETIGFRAFGNYVDSLVMQVVGLSYQPDSVQLALQSKPVSVNKRIEDIRRQLAVTDNQTAPPTPS